MATDVQGDTSRAATELTTARLRAMSPAERVRLADQLSIDVATLAAAGITAANPGIGSAELIRELARRRYGADLVRDAFGHSRAR